MATVGNTNRQAKWNKPHRGCTWKHVWVHTYIHTEKTELWFNHRKLLQNGPGIIACTLYIICLFIERPFSISSTVSDI